MRAGKLDQNLIFEKKVKTRNSFSEQSETWPTDFEVWGAFQPSGSSFFPESWKRFSQSTTRFVIRYPLPDKQLIDVALHRIRLVRDYTDPPETSIWQIFPPYAMAGKPHLLIIEAAEVK